MQEFDSIFKDFTPIVFRFLLSLCAEESLAEELTSETFYQAYLHIGQFREECKIETWLCQIAKNLFYKEQKRRGRIIQGGYPENVETDNNLFEAVANKEQALQIHKRLHLLKEPYHEVFMLRVFGDLSFKEIADVCGKSESWAKVTFYRAKNRLIEDMEGKMKFNCSVVDDLLPLYVEDICSEDSRAALEEHLQECVSCREKLARMKNGSIISDVKKKESQIQIIDYAKKIKRHRLKVGILAALISVFSACALFLCFLTVKDMYAQANPIIYKIEDGVHNLTDNALEISAEDVGQYMFYTNSSEISVTVQSKENVSGSVMLWNAADVTEWIQIGNIEGGSTSCTFTNLSASQRYKITCDGLDHAIITIHENRNISFWHSLKNVLSDIFKW